MAKRVVKKASAKKSPRTKSKPTPPPEPEEPVTKGMTLRLNLDAWKQLKSLAIDQGRTSHALLIDALNAYFKDNGKKPVA